MARKSARTPTLSWPTPRLAPDEHWLSVKDALDMIASKNDVGPEQAQKLMAKACASKRVRSRYHAIAIWEGRSTDTTRNPYLDRYLADLDDEPQIGLIVKGETKFIDPRRMQLKLAYRTINPDEWDVVSSDSIDLAVGTFRTDDAEGPIEINAGDLRRWRWLARRPRGPKPGTVSRYAEADQALFPEMTCLIHDRRITATEAARLLVDAGKVAGSGSPSSRGKRLAKAYLAETR